MEGFHLIAPAPSTSNALATWLDWGERAFLLVLYGALARGLLATHEPANLVLVASEGLAVVFVLARRRASVVSTDPRQWAVAVAATLLPTLLRPGGSPVAPWLAFATSIAGLILAASAKLALNRSLGMAPAHRGLQTRWTYALVRHPMYAGYGLVQGGFLMHNPTAWNATVLGLDWALQILRIRQEEALLSRDAAYLAYMARVRYRLVPGLF